MASDLRHLNDAALRARCRPWELLLGVILSLASPAACVAVLAMSDALLPPMLVCLGVAPSLLAGMAVWQALSAVRPLLPGAPCRDELSFREWRQGRFPFASPGQLRRWARRALSREPALDWLFVLESAGSSRASHRWIKVELTLTAGASPFRSQASGHVSIRGGAGPGARVLTRSLVPEDIEGLRRLGEATSDGLGCLERREVVDGASCALFIAKRVASGWQPAAKPALRALAASPPGAAGSSVELSRALSRLIPAG